MVSNLAITFMGISLIISLFVPIVGMIYLKKKYNASLKVFFIGALAFFIAVNIIESPIHTYFLSYNKGTASFLLNNPVAYMLYGGFMAGIMEETARLISFKFFIKGRDTTTALTYGIGHGGIEAILIGALGSLNSIVYAILINKGGFQSIMEGASVSKDVIDATYNQFVNTSSLLWLMTGIERLIALSVQIALSVLVLYAVKERKYIYYVIAIISHAIMDFPAALYQLGVLKNVYLVEISILVMAIILVTFVFKNFSTKIQNYNEII